MQSITDVYAARSPQTPTGEDLQRFVLQIPDIVQPRGEVHGDVISNSTFQQAIYQLVQYCTFTHADFNLSAHDRTRMFALTQGLQNQGLITRCGKRRERQWISITVMGAMITGLFHDALLCGVLNWDLVIYRAFSLLLTSCGGSRVGDVARSSCYTGKEYLRFEHVKIQLFEDDNVESISMFVEYAYNKGKK